MRRVVVLLAVALGAAACGSNAAVPPAPPGPPSVTEPVSVAAEGSYVAPTVDLRMVNGPAPVGNRGPEWQAVAPSRSFAMLRILWIESPYPDCGQVDTFYLSETSTRVLISLGTPHTNGYGVCGAVGRQASAVVQLAAPLGSRELIETHRF